MKELLNLFGLNNPNDSIPFVILIVAGSIMYNYIRNKKNQRGE